MSREKAHVSFTRRSNPNSTLSRSESFRRHRAPHVDKTDEETHGILLPRQRSAGRRAHNASRGVADGVFRVFAVALERALAGSRLGIVVSPQSPPSGSRPVSIPLG